MSSDWQYIQDHMGGWNEDTGLPNFMDEPGFADDGFYDYDNDDNEDYYENNNLEYEIGDIVKLTSNDDVLMTIKDINDDTIICRWFDKNHILQNAEFNKYELDIVKKKHISKQKYQNNYNIPSIDIDDEEIPF